MINGKPSRNAIPSENSHANSAGATEILQPHTIQAINRLPDHERRAIYTRLIPADLLERFSIDPSLRNSNGQDLLFLNCETGSASSEMALYHQIGFQDPLLYGQISDTIHGQVHVLLYILNDPDSPRFNVDCMPDGMPTQFGTEIRNIEAELAAMHYGLAPGQVRRGLGLLSQAIQAFEKFVSSLGQDLYFTEPLYYHNAIIFERHGFSYAKGRQLMEKIQAGFSEQGDLIPLLNSSTPFRQPKAASSIRLRSWAIHDHLLGQPFSDVTMYKIIGSRANIETSKGCEW